MRKKIGIFFLSTLVVLSAWALRQNRIYKPPQWLNGTPRLINASAKSMSAVFTLSESGVVYWRIYPMDSPAPRFADFTNTNIDAAAYGGGILQAGGSYTNHASGLQPDTGYILYSVCVPRAGAFGGLVKSLPFRTAKN